MFFQVTKLFSDKAKQKPATPRMTCTRLRKFRETRHLLVEGGNCGPENELTPNCGLVEEIVNKKESFANWVERNQQAHQELAAQQELADKQNRFHEEIKTANERDANKTVQGFANFSSSALQEVAKSPNTPVVTLKWLAASYDVKVREALASNENIDSDIVNILARDGEDSVKEAILDNKNMTREEILRLCEDENPMIAEKARDVLTRIGKPKIDRRRAMAVTANIDLATAKAIRRSRSVAETNE